MAFRQKVREGKLGKTAQFWLSIMDCANNVFALLYAVKINSVPVYHTALSDMAPLFFSFGGMNYSRYLTSFDVFLLNIDRTHPGAMELPKKGAISVARSMVPGNRCQVDKTIEETFMEFLKASCGAGGAGGSGLLENYGAYQRSMVPGNRCQADKTIKETFMEFLKSSCGAGGAGVSGLLENYGAYQRWIKTTSERAKYFESTLEMCGFPSNEETKHGKHYELSSSEMDRGEAAVKRAMGAIKGFLNPFTVDDKANLFVLSSGSPAPADIANDVLNAEQKGRQERDKFIGERLKKAAETAKDFFERLPQMKLKTLEKTNKSLKLATSKGNFIRFKEQGDLAFQLLVKSQLLDFWQNQ
ncbi:hypothetical protein ElyMa_000165100 [Elysia marginata]|uniref:Uncharacterized protein n=1 Tax=Elysia marginata TaxID=1093978 RepID=A0AAV4ES67_9GAST|nr:hypothetical protein ElyMa_000165100 [Elysia marginata]